MLVGDFHLMPNPLAVGILALMATSFMIFEWVIIEPAFHSMEVTATANVSDVAIPMIQTLHYTCYLLPIGISIGLWVWAFLAVTKRNVVTQPQF
jgi:hypothetical protein